MASKSENKPDADDVEVEDDYDDDDFEDDDEEMEGEAEVVAEEPKPEARPSAMPALPPRGMPALPPRGLAGGLPAKPGRKSEEQQPASTSTAAAPTTAAAAPSTAMPQLPAKPVGLPGLPARPGLGGTSMGAAAPTPQAPAPAATAAAGTAATKPAGGLTGLPARPGAGPTLPSRPTPAPAASAGPTLPSRPPATSAAAAGPTLRSRPAPAAPPAAAAPSLPARPAAPAAAPPSAAGGAASAATQPNLPVRPGFLRPTSQPTSAAAVAAPAAAPSVVDPTEDSKAQRIQRKVQDLRVKLIRAAGRLGLRYDAEQVTQFLSIIERIERMAGASIYKGVRRVDLNRAAEREARELDSTQAADSNLDIKIKIMVIGMTGTGKSEFINAMLERPAAKTNAFGHGTKGIKVIRGTYHGIKMEFIDTPGLHASNTMHSANKALLRKIRGAYNWHKPNYVFYVDRLDATRPSLGELSLLGLINETLGAKVWVKTMIVLTHAHACRAAMGAQYDMYSRQRRNIVMQLIRQAAGDMQIRNPMYLVDSHPSCPTNSFGQPVILDGGVNLAWKQALYMQLVGYKVYEEVQPLFVTGKAKAKAAAAPGGKQADMFRQLMRPRLPPVSYFVEQLAEGVLKPDTWAAIDDPFDVETDDEAAEEYQHMYYLLMYKLAKQGNPWAQKEWDLMLKRMQRLRRTYKEAFENEDLEMMATSGYEGYVAEGLDLGTTFDPEDGTNHRYAYFVSDSDWQIMPTLDYYGYEHEDAITGFVADYEAQFFNREGWGGFPFDLHLAVEKDKTSTCLQGESHLSIVHCVPPFGHRHITQLTGSFELLKPNLKDVLYQLEVNTFRDGLLATNDHAGCGIMMARLGEGGRIGRGPTGTGLRLQDDLRIGAFKVDACVAKVQCDGPGGGKDEAWGGRAHVLYDWIPGLGMLFDFYQQRTKENEVQVGGMASNFTYDWEMLGAACGVEVDYVIGGDVVHVDMNLFSCRDYRLAWLLVIPAWNWVKGTWQKFRSGGDPGEEEIVEGEEVEGEEEEDGGVMYA